MKTEGFSDTKCILVHLTLFTKNSHNFTETMDFESDSEDEFVSGLEITQEEADKNYQLAGTLVDEPPDEITLTKHESLLSDTIHVLIMEVLEEANIVFKLADFQLLSLHVLGSKSHLILLSPTGSGKMLGRSSAILNLSIKMSSIKLIFKM